MTAEGVGLHKLSEMVQFQFQAACHQYGASLMLFYCTMRAMVIVTVISRIVFKIK